MSSVKVIIFDVDHGFCGAVIDSNNNMLLIDCGRKTNFSPLRHLADMFYVNLSNLEIGLFILSHPHGDHIQDVENLLRSNVRNWLIQPTGYFTDQEIRDGNTTEGFNNIKKFEDGYSHFTSEGYAPPQWPFDFDYYSMPVSEARRIDSGNLINNSSHVVIIRYAGRKIIFCGDVQRS